MNRSTIGMAVFGAVSLLVAAGCGGAHNPRRPIHGKVSVNGNPVAAGMLSLYPAAGTNGPATVTEIKNGAYQFTSETGPHPGKHRVVIDFQYDPPVSALPAGQDVKVAKPAAAPAPAEEKAPWESEWEVPSDGALQKDFEIAR